MKKFFTIIFFVLIINVNAQSLQRQTIASIGAYTLDNGTLIRQTIGQSYGTTSDYSNDIRFNPGFQQPLFRVETIHSTININISVFPNPASEYINLSYTLDAKSVVSMKLINLNGQAVAELLNENQSSGTQSNTLKLPQGLDKGVYFLQATINNQQIVRKILVQ